MRRVVVVGAGVIGLTTGLALAEAGWSVHIVTRSRWPATTSAVAGGLWLPFLAEPRTRVLGWSARTLDWLYTLVDVEGAGVVLREAHELFRQPTELPEWTTIVRRLRRLSAAELPPGAVDGFSFEAPVVVPSEHLAWLEGRLRARGAVVVERTLRGWSDLDELAAEADCLVHCTGVGARALVGDEALVPVRGQVVRVRNPGLRTCVADEHHPGGLTYAVARRDDVVLGGSADVGQESLEVDEDLSARILQRVADLEPRLRDPQILGPAVGLRPVRPTVRVERDPQRPKILHNYGHGGSGFTLAWGCAREIVALAEAGG